MPAHLLAWQASADQATLTALPTVVDDIMTRSGTTRYLTPKDINYIHWGAACGVNLTRAVPDSPSLEVRRMRPEIVPHHRGAEIFALANLEIWVPPAPILLAVTEELEVDTSEDGAGATQMDAFILLGSQALEAIPTGDQRTVRAVGTTTLVARGWSTVTVTLDVSLEPGEYALIGFKAISAGVLAARAIFQGEVWRPGVIGLQGVEAAARDFDLVGYQQMTGYDMGHFTHLTIPTFQFFSASADTAEVVLMDLVKVG